MGAVYARQQHAIGFEDAVELDQPLVLSIFIQMRKDRSAPDQVECLVFERRWRQFVVDDVSISSNILLTPSDRAFVDVAPGDFEVKPAASKGRNKSSTSAAEVQEVVDVP